MNMRSQKPAVRTKKADPRSRESESEKPETDARPSGSGFRLAASSPLLVLISAPSGAGKTTLCQQLLAARRDMTRAITCTTREPRPGETDRSEEHTSEL